MAPSTQRPVTRLSPGFAFFVACLAVVEHVLLLGTAVVLIPPCALFLCLLEFGNVLVAALIFSHLLLDHPDPILPMFATATAAVAVPWSMHLFAWSGLPAGLGWWVGFLVPYLLALVLTTRFR